MATKLHSLMTVNTERVWLVSGTPFSTSLQQLTPQAQLLGISTKFSQAVRSDTNEALVDWLRQRMIRHTKNMRIGGEVALALPDADCETIWIEMSEDERLVYGIHECGDGEREKRDSNARVALFSWPLRSF